MLFRLSPTSSLKSVASPRGATSDSAIGVATATSSNRTMELPVRGEPVVMPRRNGISLGFNFLWTYDPEVIVIQDLA